MEPGAGELRLAASTLEGFIVEESGEGLTIRRSWAGPRTAAFGVFSAVWVASTIAVYAMLEPQLLVWAHAHAAVGLLLVARAVIGLVNHTRVTLGPALLHVGVEPLGVTTVLPTAQITGFLSARYQRRPNVPAYRVLARTTHDRDIELFAELDDAESARALVKRLECRLGR